MLGLSECDDATGTSCVDRVVTLHVGGPGLEDESANTQTGGGVMCQLYFTQAQATLTASSPDCRRVERWTGARRWSA